MKQFLVETRTALINRLHALYAVAGETGLMKKNLMTAGNRKQMKRLIPNDTLGMIAETIERELEVVEVVVAVYKERIAGIVQKNEAVPSLAAAFIAYVGG